MIDHIAGRKARIHVVSPDGSLRIGAERGVLLGPRCFSIRLTGSTALSGCGGLLAVVMIAPTHRAGHLSHSSVRVHGRDCMGAFEFAFAAKGKDLLADAGGSIEHSITIPAKYRRAPAQCE